MVRAIACACILGVTYVHQPSQPAPFDPVGKWSLSTTTDEGQPMTATFEITRGSGSYTGQAVTSLGRAIPIREVMTSPTGMIIVADLPQSYLVVRVIRDSSGKYTGGWGEIQQMYPLTADRVAK
ncbi:MAG: hypothetical protein ACM4AI_11895 [Acidobacteriota bacterium]